jgi:glycosyltransferase involved in cell wall biosynthesis
MISLSVVMPIFNEEKAIRRTLDELLPLCEEKDWPVIVVDDGSHDGTARILDEFAPRLQILRHPYNRGYGASLKTGIRAAVTEFVATYDSDGQHRPEDLLRLATVAPQCDMIIGERTPGSQVDVLRIPGKWFLTHAANFIVGRQIPDINSGLRIIRRVFIKKVLHLMPDGFSFTSTSTVAAIKMGFLVEFAAIQTRRRIGTSTVQQVRHGLMVLMLILRLVVLFSPLRIFIPTAITLAVIGILYAVYVIATVRLTLANGALLCLLTAVIIFFFGLLVDQVSAMRRERHLDED